MSTELQKLIDVFKDAEGFSAKYVAYKTPIEFFITPVENVQPFIGHIMLNYDENLNHINYSGKRITGYTYGNTFEQIEKTI